MKHIIVTGASRGIGFELIQKFAASGHQVLALSRNIRTIKQLNNPNITALSFDLSITSDIEKVVSFVEKEWKQVAILVNNAGRLISKPFAELTAADFKAVYEVNVFGLAAITRAILPFMPSEGHVVSISSMGGVQGSVKFPGLSAYSSAKGAVITLTELLAEEYKDSGPSFNVLALGAVRTEMLAEAFPDYQAPTTAEEMASYICDFALTGNKFYNGKLLQVSNSTP